MKKLLLFGFVFAGFISVKAQSCSDLFISEYVEGTSNNKALEIYNPTPNPITVNGNYRLVRYDNGSSQATAESSAPNCVLLGVNDPGNTGTSVTTEPFVIQPYDVYVIVIDLRDPNGSGQTAPVDVNLQAQADTFMCPNYNTSKVMYFNGNDALSLQKWNGSSWVFVDIFGEIGFDPHPGGSGDSNGWTDCPPFYGWDAATCNYTHVWTADQTLIRHPDVQGGVTVSPSPFDVTVEWDSLPKNTYSNLGSHTCNCNVAGIAETKSLTGSQVKLFPNPSNGGTINFVSADKKIAAIIITNAIGQRVKEISLSIPATQTNQDLNLNKGIYFTEIIFSDKSRSGEKLIIE